MSKVRILPEQLANRIAAGEVVERPASVVKELLENSLDAGANRIEIEIEGSGTRLIRVMDNGEGMDEDDLLLSLERHGTSKIATDQDLSAINTLGFRGEAIPSIGSVSRMTITSRTPHSPLGSMVVQDFGKLIKVHETGCHPGTLIEIRNLFANTPARRKFLRTNRTELAHIEDVVKGYALAATAVAFILRVDSREVIHFTKDQDLRHRLAAIMHYQGPLLEVGRPDSRSHAPRVHGFLLPPDAMVAGSAGLRLLVNGRTVRDRMVAHAVAEGFRNFLMKGRAPVGLIHLHLPPGDVDVNVHPTKQEIRLRDSQAIHTLISLAVEQAIHTHQQDIQTTVFRTPAPAPKPQSAPPTAVLPPAPDTPSVAEESNTIVTTERLPSYACPSVPTPRPLPQTRPQPLTMPGPAADSTTCAPARQPALPAQPAPPEAETGNGGHGLRVIGQHDNLYIFCQAADGGLVVVDQHAAHERLLFEDLKKQFMQGHVASQTLLFPATIELSIALAEQVEHHAAEIAQLGFTVREFGGSSFIISAIPAMAGQCDPGTLLFDTLERFGGDQEKKARGSRLDDILASMACKAAVKAGDRLHSREIDALLTRMAKADLFSHCPHGRPVLKHFTASEIKKWFHRP